MDTLPLDLDSVLGELGAADAEANGMPAGTRIGHVHLNVAELSAAEDFYGGLLGFEVTVRGYPGALFLVRRRLPPPRRRQHLGRRRSGGAPAGVPRAALVRDRAPGRGPARADGAAPSRRGVRGSERRGGPASRRSLGQRHPAHRSSRGSRSRAHTRRRPGPKAVPGTRPARPARPRRSARRAAARRPRPGPGAHRSSFAIPAVVSSA